jgi:hypothetical protein
MGKELLFEISLNRLDLPTFCQVGVGGTRHADGQNLGGLSAKVGVKVCILMRYCLRLFT